MIEEKVIVKQIEKLGEEIYQYEQNLSKTQQLAQNLMNKIVLKKGGLEELKNLLNNNESSGKGKKVK
jgi:hypothetical protein